MGRDTGVILKANFKPRIPFWVRDHGFASVDDTYTSIEICYWRNMHRLVNLISGEFDMYERDYADCKICSDDIKEIMSIIKRQVRYDPRLTLRERISLIQDYINLSWVCRLSETHDVEIVYYDSF